MTGSARPPDQPIERDPIYGYVSGAQPTETLLSIHDRVTEHRGELPASLVALATEIDPVDLPEGMTLLDALALLEEMVSTQEATGV